MVHLKQNNCDIIHIIVYCNNIRHILRPNKSHIVSIETQIYDFTKLHKTLEKNEVKAISLTQRNCIN